MVFYIGVVIMLVGAAGALLKFTGTENLIPFLGNAPVSITAWIVVAIVGCGIAMVTRRARD